MNEESSLEQAEWSLRNGDAAGAERSLTKAWPDMTRAPADAQHTLAMVRLHQGREKEAEQLMRSALKLDPSALRHLIGLGHILTALQNDAGALEAYTSASRIDPKWRDLFVAISQANYRLKRYADAERAGRSAVDAVPTAAAYECLSNALRAQGKAQEALAAAEEALKFDRQDVNAQHAKATALVGLNRAQEALAIFDALLARGIDLPVLHMNRGVALEAMGRTADARAVYEEAARRFPNLPNLQQQVADARKRV